MESVSTVPKTVRDYSYLRPYQFKPGHGKIAGGGRPKGSKSFSTILREQEEAIAARYLTRLKKSDVVLLDAAERLDPKLKTAAAPAQILVVSLTQCGDTLQPSSLRSVADTATVVLTDTPS